MCLNRRKCEEVYREVEVVDRELRRYREEARRMIEGAISSGKPGMYLDSYSSITINQARLGGYLSKLRSQLCVDCKCVFKERGKNYV